MREKEREGERRRGRDREREGEKRRESEGESCLLYTSDAADEDRSVDLCGRRIIKKKIF